MGNGGRNEPPKGIKGFCSVESTVDVLAGNKQELVSSASPAALFISGRFWEQFAALFPFCHAYMGKLSVIISKWPVSSFRHN